MELSIIVATAENNAIGKGNQLLWHLPNDLKFFKNKTWGMPVIMGRKTYESVNKPLPGRINIVISSNPDWKAEGVISAVNIEDAIEKARSANCKISFIIGGGEIYNHTLKMANTVYLTRVHANLEGDTFFPDLDPALWELVSNEFHHKDEKHIYDYSFQTWVHRPGKNITR